MLSVRNLLGIEEPISDFQNLKRVRRINGEKTISLTILKSPGNEHCFDLIEEESVISFGEDEYVIKVMSERSLGKRTAKHVEAIHRFYVNLINKQQTNIHNGSITFNNYMNLVFDDTDYTFVAIDPFPARSFENLGDDNRLSLLKKGLDRFKAEMELVGNQVRFKERIGNDTDFQFRYGHNIKTIERAVDTTNLATVIRGKGDPELGIEAYYESPNVSIFGVIDAPTVNDERFKSEESILEEMVSRLHDTPDFSLTIDFIDLRASGYPYTIPNEGDSVFVIYEPMGDLEVDTRINEIEEYFNINLEPIETHVTLANHKKTFAGTMFDNVQKQIDGIVNDDGVIRYNVLDEAVKIATEALKSAQTELIFENGIIARDKDNPNRVVIFNSNGFGLSDDGGQTVREAITADGFVLSAGAIGKLSANHIQIGPGTEFKEGYDPTKIKTEFRESLRLTAPLPTSISMGNYGIRASTSLPNRYAQLDYRGLYIAGGAIQIDGGLPDREIASSTTWNRQGTYINSQGIYTGQISATQVTLGFNTISDNVKITPRGLETYSGAYRTSLLDGTGHRFYRDEKYIGRIGTAGLHSYPDLRGLNFQLSDEAHYMSWSHLKNANDPYYTIMFAWYKNRQADTEKGFVFSDNITLRSDNVLYARTLSTTNYSSGNRHIQLQNYTWKGFDGVKIRKSVSGAGLFLTQDRATLKNDGNAYIEVTQDSTGNRIESTDIRNRHYTSTTNLVRVTEDGVLGISTSSRRYKLLEEPIPLEYAKKILDLEPKTWYDKQTAEDYALELTEGGDFENLPIKRLPGVIAEDLHDLGLGTFVEYDEDKKPNGINHMLWVLLLPIVKKQQAEINELKSLMGVS